MPVRPVASVRLRHRAATKRTRPKRTRVTSVSWPRPRASPSGSAGAGDVFRDGCRDRAASLRWQLGGLTKAMDYLTDAGNYLEPWYGIGVTVAAFGAEYEWPEGQAPVRGRVTAPLTKSPRSPPVRPRRHRSCATCWR